MKVEYDYTFGLPAKIVWHCIKDATLLKKSLTGCKQFDEISKGIYQAIVDINFGTIQDVFTLSIQRAKEQSPSYYHLIVKGKGELVELNGKADLFIQGLQGSSKMTIQVEAELTGSLAIVGKRVLEGSAKKSLDSFLQKVEKEMKKYLYQQKRER